MDKPLRPFERYRTRSALFLMIYSVTALVFGIPNIMMVTYEDDRLLILLATSVLVVSKYVGYIHLAGFALLEPARIRTASARIAVSIAVIALVLLANAVFLIYRFGLRDISVAAVAGGNLATAAILVQRLVASRRTGLTGAQLMKMVSGVLIALGSADICITRFYLLSPIIGFVTLFFGISTERKSLKLAFKQTLAAAASAAGCGVTVYYMRWFIDPALLVHRYVDPVAAMSIGLTMGIAGLAYYMFLRRVYTREPALIHENNSSGKTGA